MEIHCEKLNQTHIYVKCPCPHLCKQKYHKHGNLLGMKNRVVDRLSHCLSYPGIIDIRIDDKTIKNNVK